MKWSDFLSAEKQLLLSKTSSAEDPTFVGIDFGTSTTVVSIAKLDEDGNIKVDHIDISQKKFNGASIVDYRINSVVAKYKDKILIGAGAKEMRTKLEPNVNYWTSFKMQLGSDVGVAYPKSEIESIKNPTDITTLFFKALKKSIDIYIDEKGLSKEIKYAVTIPASFESHHRRDLIKCLNEANIEIEESGLIDEPNAAFLSYSLLPNINGNELYISDEFNPNVLIFDFGAGTCDISIIEIGENTNGLYTKNISLSQFAEIGGDNFDKLLAERVLLPQLLEQSRIKKSELRKKEIQLEILPHLKDLGEKLKIQVAERIEAYHDIINLPENELIEQRFHLAITKRINSRLGDLHLQNPEINLKQFIEISNTFNFDTDFKDLNLQINPVFSAMEKSKLNPEDIDFVLFIGGSTKNFIIRKQVKSVFKKATPLEPTNPQSQVSLGAAIHSLLLNKFNTHIIRPITNQNVFTKIISDNREQIVTLINPGEPIPFPTKIFDQFQPKKTGQKVIEIPFFTGTDTSELEKIILESPNQDGFHIKDKIQLLVDVNANKVLIITAKINDIEVKVNIENPFISEGKTIVNKEIRNAIKTFNIESKENKGSPSFRTYKNMISTYEKHEDYMSAAELLEEAVERFNVNNEYNNLNLLFSKAGNEEKSLKYAEKAIESRPNNSSILFNMASKLRFSNPKKAIELLQKAIKIDPTSPTINYLLGTLLKGEEGNDLKREAFNLWQVKLLNDEMNSWDYSWFSSCAWDLGEHTLYHEILQKEADLQKQNERFYNPENLMGMSENNSKK
jgi:molecular chaperone DnaK (HSP70)